ncbi:hypothetical protein [Isoalcanivorax indicus]|uniref:hypothetical protein n=1 Tax=Isoalcanivorax indicus TaxID=2202653 RepID=UPI0013C44628|nr:hypothetical protein [Isoalcanivorax indicus]
MRKMTGATTAIRNASRRWLTGAAVLLGAAGLASCNGGEDFSDVNLPGCAFGAQCTENLAGNRLVELVGPRVDNLRYRCGTGNSGSISHLRDEEVVTAAGIRVPPFTAVCPASAKKLEFFIGNGFFDSSTNSTGDLKVIGTMFFPTTSLQVPQGTTPPVLSVTLNDLVESARRVAKSDAKVRNRGLLLSALDSDTDDEVIYIPDELHTLVGNRFADLIGNRSLDTSGESAFRTDFQPLLDALNEELALVEGDPGFHEFPDDLVDFNERLQAAMNLSRAGYYAMGYNDNAEIGVLEFLNTIKDPNFDNLGRFSASLLVLPSGDIVGLGSVLVSVDMGTERETRRDAVLASGVLNDELVFSGVTFTDLLAIEETMLELGGRMLGEIMYNGVPGVEGAGRSDVEIDQPDMPYEPDEESDFGRLTGVFLDVDTVDMINDADTDAPGLPVRAARQPRSVVQLDQGVLADLDGSRYLMTLKRGCLPSEEEAEECDAEIADEDAQYYPQRFEVIESVDGSGDSSVELTFSFSSETVRRDGDDSAGVANTCLEIRYEGGNGIIYVGLDGICPNDPATDLPVGYVTRTTFDDDDQPESAGIVLYLAADAASHAQLGTQIEGRIALQDCTRPLYRLADNNFNDGIRASWVDNFLPVQLQLDALAQDPEHDFSDMDDEVNQRLISNVQGLVDLEYTGGGEAFTCE